MKAGGAGRTLFWEAKSLPSLGFQLNSGAKGSIPLPPDPPCPTLTLPTCVIHQLLQVLHLECPESLIPSELLTLQGGYSEMAVSVSGFVS